ncbi:MAG TPA: amidohydrolase family protein [Rhizomicrobium sp.]|jgi:adenine deaminase
MKAPPCQPVWLPAGKSIFLGLDVGVIAPGKLADIVLVEGNPLENIANAHKVRRVIANGRMFTIEDVVGKSQGRTALIRQTI